MRGEEATKEEKAPLVKGKALKDLVPVSYKELVRAKGDLNKDALEDVAIVYDMLEAESDGGKRACVVFLQEPGGGYKLLAENQEVAMCKDCGGMMGDPFVTEDFVIDAGRLVVVK